MEQAVLVIPENIAIAIQSGESVSLSRRLLELATVKAYELNRISSKQVMEALNLPDREMLYQFFKNNEVKNAYTMEELERDTDKLEALLQQRQQ